MNNAFSDPSDGLEGDEQPSPQEECELYGHSYEGNDTISEFCVVCGCVREYASRAERRLEFAKSDDIHTCRTAADHAFGFNGRCSYCGTAEATLTEAERELRSAVREKRRAAAVESNSDFGFFDED